jgi:hypothetical protein
VRSNVESRSEMLGGHRLLDFKYRIEVERRYSLEARLWGRPVINCGAGTSRRRLETIKAAVLGPEAQTHS